MAQCDVVRIQIQRRGFDSSQLTLFACMLNAQKGAKNRMSIKISLPSSRQALIISTGFSTWTWILVSTEVT